MRYMIITHGIKGANHVCWSTNCEYELGNIIKDYDRNFELIKVKWRKGRLTRFDIVYDPKRLSWSGEDDPRGNLRVWDTLNHWPVGVKDMGAFLSEHLGTDLSKLEPDYYGLKYAAMDAIISRSYACVQRAYYDKKGISLKTTPGATAMDLYQRGIGGKKFCQTKILKTHTKEELDWLDEGTRGGRTEAFSLRPHRGLIRYLDINSAYPFSMKYPNYPDPSKHFWVNGHKKIRQHIDANFEGMVDCEVEAINLTPFAMIYPYLGTVDQDTLRFLFPLGKWRAKYTFFEIRQAEKLGYKFKFKEAIVYERCRNHPFQDYVDFCYAIRLEGQEKKEKLLKDIGKSLGNNLYGKFGQRLIYTKFDDPAKYLAEDIMHAQQFGNGVIVEEDGGYAPHTNKIWSAYITSICRDLLYQHMMKAWMEGNQVLYCDSVTKDRRVLIRDNESGRISNPRIEELFPAALESTGKEYFTPKGISTLAYDPGNKDRLEWRNVKRVIRHKTNKKIFEVRNNKGITKITEDHSLINDKNERVKIGECEDFFSVKNLSNIPQEESSVDLLAYLGGVTFRAYGEREHYYSFIEKDGRLFLQKNETGALAKGSIPRRLSGRDLQGFCSVLGFFIAEGSVSIPGVTTKTSKWNFSICNDDTKYLEEQKKLLERLTGMDFSMFKSSAAGLDNTWKVSSSSVFMACLFAALTGLKSKGRKIPDFMFSLKREFKQAMLDAMVKGDGSHTKDERFSAEYRATNFAYTTISEELCNNLAVILSMLGRNYSVNYREAKGSYTLVTSSKSRVKPLKVREIEYSDYVYDLEVEGLHNFFDTAGMIGLHNTDSIFITGGKIPENDESRLGALKHEGDLYYFKAYLPKQYEYQKMSKGGDGPQTGADGKPLVTYKAKGVPQKHEKLDEHGKALLDENGKPIIVNLHELYFQTGNVSFKKPLKFREALRRKNIKDKNIGRGVDAVNAWVTVTKENRGLYTKREVLKNKWTLPIWLNMKRPKWYRPPKEFCGK